MTLIENQYGNVDLLATATDLDKRLTALEGKTETETVVEPVKGETFTVTANERVEAPAAEEHHEG